MTSKPPVVLGRNGAQTERCRNRLFGDRGQEMGGGIARRGPGPANPLQPVRGCKSATRRTVGLGGARGPGAAGPRPDRRDGRAGDQDPRGAALPVPALRRDHDRAAARTVRSPALLGVRHRAFALSVRDAGAVAGRDASPGLPMAIGFRDGALDDVAGVAAGHRAGPPAFPGAAVTAERIPATAGPASGRDAVRVGALHRRRRSSSVRRSRARCMRTLVAGPPRSRAPPS